jgi:hypothetical protein
LQHWSPNAHSFGAKGKALEDVCATPNTAVYKHLFMLVVLCVVSDVVQLTVTQDWDKKNKIEANTTQPPSSCAGLLHAAHS